MGMDWKQLVPTRRSLLSRLKNWDDQKSYQDFYEIYHPLIYGAAVKAGLTETEAEDVVQETATAVAKAIRDLKFKYEPERSSFKTWLHGITKRKVFDQFRKRLGKGRVVETLATDNQDSSLASEIPDPASQVLDEIWDREWERTLLCAAMERVKRQVSPDQFQIYNYYAVQGHTTIETARALGVSAAKVHLAKHRVEKKVRVQVAHLRNKLV
jgi:RNA polymerase sigma-70 factor (ECF subfamily)